MFLVECTICCIVSRNIVSTVNLDCKLDLKAIALQARNAEYNPKASGVLCATHHGRQESHFQGEILLFPFEFELLRISISISMTAFCCCYYENKGAKNHRIDICIWEDGKPFSI